MKIKYIGPFRKDGIDEPALSLLNGDLQPLYGWWIIEHEDGFIEKKRGSEYKYNKIKKEML